MFECCEKERSSQKVLRDKLKHCHLRYFHGKKRIKPDHCLMAGVAIQRMEEFLSVIGYPYLPLRYCAAYITGADSRKCLCFRGTGGDRLHA